MSKKKIVDWYEKKYLDLSITEQMIVDDWIEDQYWISNSGSAFWDTENNIFIGETRSDVWKFLDDQQKMEIFE